MGIQGLSKLISDNTSSAVRENEIKQYFGRKVAIDASMSIYQFLIAVRQGMDNLTNADGETTSHLMGMFYRTVRMITNGIKPVYVFDGKPPTMKSGELAKRKERRQQAQDGLAAATEDGNQEDMEKFTRRLVRVTPKHNEECQELLKLMGVPFVRAPCEAEAQCAKLCAAGSVFATATEDMDSLTFGSTVLLRHMTFSEARKMPIKEFHLERILAELELSMPEFIDMCILLGCDYCAKIPGIGPHKAINLIRKYKCIEEILKNIDKKKHPVADDWKYAEARQLFVTPDVTPAVDVELKWTAPDVDGLVALMCTKNGFAEDRIRNGAAKLLKARSGKTQGRVDSFFKVLPSSAPKKRKADDKKAKGKKKVAKGKGGFKR